MSEGTGIRKMSFCDAMSRMAAVGSPAVLNAASMLPSRSEFAASAKFWYCSLMSS